MLMLTYRFQDLWLVYNHRGGLRMNSLISSNPLSGPNLFTLLKRKLGNCRWNLFGCDAIPWKNVETIILYWGNHSLRLKPSQNVTDPTSGISEGVKCTETLKLIGLLLQQCFINLFVCSVVCRMYIIHFTYMEIILFLLS